SPRTSSRTSGARSFPVRVCRRTRTRGSCPTSGSSRPCRWVSARSPRSTRRASTATSCTAGSPTRAARAYGRSSATASAMSRKSVEHLSDDELRMLRRGGHDYRKLYAAYSAAVAHRDAPTVVLAQTVKGWTLGPNVEARNVTHQAKKLSVEELKIFRDRLELP